MLPDADQAHQIFIFHQSLCTRNRKHGLNNKVNGVISVRVARRHVHISGKEGAEAH